MAAELITLPFRPVINTRGVLEPGALLDVFQTGTTTRISVFADADLSVELTNPVVADSAGVLPTVYWDNAQAIRVRLRLANGSTLAEADPYYSDGLSSTDLSFTPTGTGAVARTVQAKLRETVSAKDFGAVGDGVADDTAAIQAAIDAAAAAGPVLHVPAGTYRLTSPVEVPAGGVIEGVSGLYMANTFSGRTVFHIDHTGKGFTCTGALGGRAFRHLATLRNQPTSFVLGWAPTANDWDFETSGATDVSFDDILLINATKGIGHVEGGGRFTHNRIWGQPLEIGIEVEEALDVVRSTAIHFWPFWSATKTGFAFVEDWTVKNGTAYYSKRNDNPEVFGLFSLLYRHCLRIGQKTTGNSGTTKRMRAYNVGGDVVGSALTVDSDANGAKVDIYGFYAQGAPNDTGAALINIEGTNSDIRIHGRTDLTEARTNAIRLVGSGSALTVNDLVIDEYNVENDGNAAVFVDPAAFALTVRGETAIVNGVGGAAAYAGGGRINTLIPQAYTPTVTTGTGTITSLFENTATFTVQDKLVTVRGKIVINLNGTGATDLRVSLPATVSTEGIGFAWGTGNLIGSVRVVSSFAAAVISRADGTYIGGNGADILYQFSYGIA